MGTEARVITTLRRWFIEFGPVPRGVYARDGALLMGVKYLLDALFIRAVSGAWWTPVDYLSPGITLRQEKLALVPGWALVVLVVWTLPFVWIGLSYSLRRAIDAGRNPWIALYFFVPFLGYLTMLYLALAPGRAAGVEEARARVAASAPSWMNAGVAIAITLAIALLFVAGSTLWLGSYGISLFFALPAVLGVVTGWAHNREALRSGGETTRVALLGLLILGLLLLAFAWEGAVCLAMALPLALPLTLGGALIGRALAQFRPRAAVMPALFVLPAGLGVDAMLPVATPPRVVMSSVVIDASPDSVWRHVIDFPDLPPPTEWIFRTGIAYPIRARLDGTGVGAIRHCEFTTGSFVEPITAWEPGRRLAFDVAEQPEPMRELSPWGRIVPAHLNSGFRSVQGEFLLVPLPDGRTRLEGRTWYRVGLAPATYWEPVTDAIIHAIHQRVLEQVRRTSEGRGNG